MMYHKKAMLLLALSAAGQTECAGSRIAKVVFAGSAVGSIALAGKLFALRRATEEMIKDPNAKQALEMLNSKDGKKCTLTYSTTFFGVIANPGGAEGPEVFGTEEDVTFNDETPGLAYARMYFSGQVRSLRERPVNDLVVCNDDSCVKVDSIKTRGQLEDFLERVDAAKAPICGYEAPALRRLVNRIINP